MDNGRPAPASFSAPQPQLFAMIIEGVLDRKLEWGLVITGVLIAVVVELVGVSALPFAVGMYLPLRLLDADLRRRHDPLAGRSLARASRPRRPRPRPAQACCFPAASSPAAR